MENKKVGSRRVWAAVRDSADGSPRRGLSLGVDLLSRGHRFGWAKLLVLLVLAPVAQAANPSSTTYTGAPLNLEIPGEDSYDYWGSFDRNFRVLNSSYSDSSTSISNLSSTVSSLSASTTSIAASTTSLAAARVPYSGATANVVLGTNNLSTSYGISAATGAFSATGGTQFSIVSSSGINILAGGIRWPDNSISTTASSGGGGAPAASFSVASASFTMGTSASFAFTVDEFRCVTGSTITFSVSSANNNVEINLDGEAIHNTDGATAMTGVLVDGGYFHTSEVTHRSGYATKIGWYWRKKLSAGSHSFCLFGMMGTGTYTMYGQSVGRESGYFIRETSETTP